jgi:sarcosine oxidase
MLTTTPATQPTTREAATPTERRFDVIVIGLGVMGSAVLAQLAARAARVLGLDRFRPPHPFGSSHGETRIIREAYFEHPAYVPLVQRAYELWRALETEQRQSLLIRTGGVMIGAPDGVIVQGALRSSALHRLDHERWTAAQLRARYPMLTPPDAMHAVWEPRAGVLLAEPCVAALLRAARERSAAILEDTAVERISAESSGLRIETDQGEFAAEQVVVSAGAWAGELIPQLASRLQVERQVLAWYRPPAPELFAPDRCPVHIWEQAPGRYFYGFPDLGQGVKLARHHQGASCTAASIQREVDQTDLDPLDRITQQLLPACHGRLERTATCLYTNTRDEHFLIDRLPDDPRLVIVSPCSGHGFKFAPAIGELVADALCSAARFQQHKLFGWR